VAVEVKKLKTAEAVSNGTKKGGFSTLMLLTTALVLALSAGALTGVLASYYLNNSRYSVEVSALATYRPPQVTTIYADDGETVLAEFAIEKRIPIKIQDVPDVVKDALMAVEDYRFRDHIGIDPYRIVGAVFKNLTTGDLQGQGASTITQQLAKNLFLYKDKTYTRKVNEWAVALQIERLYTKDQILEMYMNYVFLGAGAYGFEAGSRTYFGKPLKELNLEEAALLAAIPKSPSEYSPTRNLDKAKMRRNLVLDQMAKYAYITEAQAESAKATQIQLADTAYYQSQPKSTAWDYPVEEIRKYLEEKYTTRVAQGGLKVYTSINVEAQKIATRVVRERLRAFDRGRKWRSDYQNILVNDNDEPITTDEKEIAKALESFKHADWYGDDYHEGEYIKGLVMKVNAAADEVGVRFGRYKAVVRSSNMGRSVKRPKDELKPGFLAEFHVKSVDTDNQTLEVELTQVPDVQASLVTIDAKTGEIVCMVGGYDFQTNKFNNATQGLRQTGSAYKPFVYTAAVESGMTPESVVSGAPIKRGGWQPHNFDGSLGHGNTPMKMALAKSYNIAAVHLLDQVGIQAGAQMVRRFGITNPMAPSLPSALGASEASLLEMTAAYSAFPNKGVRMAPHMIRKVYNRDGSLLEEYDGASSKVTSEYTALTMVEMMRAVCSGGGTAAGASAGGNPIAGKTGTVNDHTDVWFIGYTPTYTTGVWMGNPLRKENLGSGMTGGHGALPFWNSFMIPFMKGKPVEKFPDAPPMPADIKREAELRRREELETLQDADANAPKSGIVVTPGAKIDPNAPLPGDATEGDKPVTTKQSDPEPDKPPVIKAPVVQNTPKNEPPPDKPDGSKRKGKKGDG